MNEIQWTNETHFFIKSLSLSLSIYLSIYLILFSKGAHSLL